MNDMYVSCDKTVYGPLTDEVFYQWLQEGRLKVSDWIWIHDNQDWYPVIEIPQLSSYFYSAADKPIVNPETESSTGAAGTKIFVSSEQIDFQGQEVEKRLYRRHAIDIQLFFAPFSQFSNRDEKIYTTSTLDLSITGIGFMSKVKFDIGDELETTMEIFPDQFKSRAKVVRVVEKPAGFYIGVKFVQTPKVELDKLAKFIKVI